MTTVDNITTTFSYKLGFTDEDLGPAKTVFLTKTNLPVPKSTVVANFTQNMVLEGTDSNGDPIKFFKITSLPDPNEGILYVDSDQVLLDQLIEAVEGNVVVYYTSENTHTTPKPDSETSFTFQVASQIDSNYDLNWSIESGIVNFVKYTPPQLSVDPILVEHEKTVQVNFNLVYDLDSPSTYNGAYYVTRLPEKGHLHLEDSTDVITTTTSIVPNTSVFYTSDNTELGPDSFDIIFRDDLTASDEITANTLVVTVPRSIDSTKLTYSHTQEEGFDSTNDSVVLELSLGDVSDLEIDSTSPWSVQTRVFVDAAQTSHGVLVYDNTDIVNNTDILIDGFASNLTIQYKIDLNDSSAFDYGVLDDTLNYMISFVYTYNDDSAEYTYVNETIETFTFSLYQPPQLLDASERTFYVNKCGRTRIFNDSIEDDPTTVNSYNIDDVPFEGFVLWKSESGEAIHEAGGSILLSMDDVFFEISGYTPTATNLEYDFYHTNDSHDGLTITLTGTRDVPQDFSFMHTTTYPQNNLPTKQSRTVNIEIN